jgi:hypothetical protein
MKYGKCSERDSQSAIVPFGKGTSWVQKTTETVSGEDEVRELDWADSQALAGYLEFWWDSLTDGIRLFETQKKLIVITIIWFENY